MEEINSCISYHVETNIQRVEHFLYQWAPISPHFKDYLPEVKPGAEVAQRLRLVRVVAIVGVDLRQTCAIE